MESRFLHTCRTGGEGGWLDDATGKARDTGHWVGGAHSAPEKLPLQSDPCNIWQRCVWLAAEQLEEVRTANRTVWVRALTEIIFRHCTVAAADDCQRRTCEVR